MPTRAEVNTEFNTVATLLSGEMALANDGRYPQKIMEPTRSENARGTLDGSLAPPDRTQSIDEALSITLSGLGLLYIVVGVDEYEGPYGLGAFLRAQYVGASVTVERGAVLTGVDPAFVDYDWRTIET